jgi:hypothetical protein
MNSDFLLSHEKNMKAISVRLKESAILQLVLWTNPPVNVFLFSIWDAPSGLGKQAGIFYWVLVCHPSQVGLSKR